MYTISTDLEKWKHGKRTLLELSGVLVFSTGMQRNIEMQTQAPNRIIPIGVARYLGRGRRSVVVVAEERHGLGKPGQKPIPGSLAGTGFMDIREDRFDHCDPLAVF